jgi:integral membrane protein (TIGR01906 family)
VLRVAAVVVAALLPLFFVANAMRLLLSETYVRTATPRLDGGSLGDARRTELALLGLRAVDPLRGSRVEILRGPRLEDGSRAFTAREVRHMRDVRAWIWRLHVFEVVVAAALVALALRARATLEWVLVRGAVATAAIAALAVVAMLLDFDVVLLGFHKLLFEGESWHFRDSDTLIRVYPEEFWTWTGLAIGVLALAQAAIAFAIGKAFEGRSRTAPA